MSEAVAADQLRLLIERIERLEEEKKGIAEDIKDVFGEAKATGFDVKAMRTVIAMRKLEKQKRDEQQMIVGTYAAVLGMQLAFDI